MTIIFVVDLVVMLGGGGRGYVLLKVIRSRKQNTSYLNRIDYAYSYG